jgi:hypothetical protein
MHAGQLHCANRSISFKLIVGLDPARDLSRGPTKRSLVPGKKIVPNPAARRQASESVESAPQRMTAETV